MANAMTLQADRLTVSFGSHLALSDCTLSFSPGQLVGLLGPNGAGKTTLLRGLAGLVSSGGDVRWQDRSLSHLDGRQRATAIAYLPQSAAVPWPLTVRELVELGRLPHRSFGQRMRASDYAATERAMAAANVSELEHRRIDELSGGELMRAHFARVLAVEAPVLLVDEPVANLDPAHQLLIMELLAAYAADGRCVVAVMHDVTLAARFCDRIVLLKDGALVSDGDPLSVLSERTLSAVYGVSAIIREHAGDSLVVPWRRLEAKR